MSETWYSLMLFAFTAWVGVASIAAWSETHASAIVIAVIIAICLLPLAALRD
jgi:hypothetical protein